MCQLVHVIELRRNLAVFVQNLVIRTDFTFQYCPSTDPNKLSCQENFILIIKFSNDDDEDDDIDNDNDNDDTKHKTKDPWKKIYFITVFKISGHPVIQSD